MSEMTESLDSVAKSQREFIALLWNKLHVGPCCGPATCAACEATSIHANAALHLGLVPYEVEYIAAMEAANKEMGK